MPYPSPMDRAETEDRRTAALEWDCVCPICGEKRVVLSRTPPPGGQFQFACHKCTSGDTHD